MKRLTAIISLLLTICLVFSGCGVELSDTPSQTINSNISTENSVTTETSSNSSTTSTPDNIGNLTLCGKGLT